MIPHKPAHFDVIGAVATVPPISKSVDGDVEDQGDLRLGQKLVQRRYYRVAIALTHRQAPARLVSVSNPSGFAWPVSVCSIPPWTTLWTVSPMEFFVNLKSSVGQTA